MPPLPLGAVENQRGSQTHRQFGLVSFGHNKTMSGVGTNSTIGTARSNSSKASKRYHNFGEIPEEDLSNYQPFARQSDSLVPSAAAETPTLNTDRKY
jgi:hypothetical protein